MFMSISRILSLAFLLYSFGVTDSSAQIIDYSITGAFGSSAPSTLLSAPNATFDLQFSLAAQQPPNQFTNAFDAYFTDESYSLNGRTIFSGQSGRASFGMGFGTPTDTLDVYLPPQYGYGFFFNAFQVLLYSGPVSDPTLVPASFDFLAGGLTISQGLGANLANSHATATAAVQEPPPAALAGTATLFMAGALIVSPHSVRRSPFSVRRSPFSAFSRVLGVPGVPNTVFDTR